MVERWENIMFFPTSTIEPGDFMLGKNVIFPNLYMMGKNREFFYLAIAKVQPTQDSPFMLWGFDPLHRIKSYITKSY